MRQVRGMDSEAPSNLARRGGVGRTPVIGITASLNPEPSAQVGVPVIGVRGPDIDAV
ncbi:MAG: hypothetical protein RL022_3143, partial [Chloroflexota bacterium]